MPPPVKLFCPVGAQKITGQKLYLPAIKSDRPDFWYDRNGTAEARRSQGLAYKALAYVRPVFCTGRSEFLLFSP
jgi:hypothetical protein